MTGAARIDHSTSTFLEGHSRPEPGRRPSAADLRMPVLGAAAWLGGITAQRSGAVAYAVLLGVAALLGLLAPRLTPGRIRLLLAVVLVAGAAVTGTVLRHDACVARRCATSPASAPPPTSWEPWCPIRG